MMKTKRLCLVLSLLLLSGCGLLPQEKQRQQAPVLEAYQDDPYTYVHVQQGSVVNEIRGSATVVAVQAQTLAFADEIRPLEACRVSLGQQVKAGDVLCTLQAEDLAEVRFQLQTELSLKELELEYCRQCNALDLEKENLLLSRLSGAARQAKQESIDSLAREFAAKEEALTVQLQELQARMALLEQEYAACSLVAPMDGTVTKLSSDRRSVEISDLSECLLKLNDKDAANFPAGTVVTLSLDDRSQQGTVLTAAQAGRESGTFIRPDDPGSFAGTSRWEASFIADAAEDALYLPASAVRQAGGKDCVYILDENGLITTCEITVGITGGGLAQILSGLTEGQQVILNY